MPAWDEITLDSRNPDNCKTSNIAETELSSSKNKQVSPSESKTENVSKAPQTKSTKTIILGLSYGFFAGLSFSVCSASVKYLKDLDPGQVSFYLYIAMAVFSLPMVVKNNESLLGPDKSTKYWFLLCGVCDAASVYFTYLSLMYLPLSDAIILISTSPVFVTISARIFLKENCGMLQILAIAISMMGVALVSKAPLLLASRTGVYTRESVIGLLAAFGSLAADSGVYISLRKLCDVNNFTILFNLAIVATATCAMITLSFGTFTWTACGVDQWLVIVVSVFSFFFQLALAKALELQEVGPVCVVQAAGDIILAFILDMTLFHHTPDIYTICGTILVVSSVMLVGFQNGLRQWCAAKLRTGSLELNGKRFSTGKIPKILDAVHIGKFRATEEIYAMEKVQ